MLSLFNSLTPYSYKTGGRMPNGWSYYTDSSGIHFNTSANLVTAKGRYVSFWRTRVTCRDVAGQVIPVPIITRTYTTCRTTRTTKTTSKQVCINGSISIECASENPNGCHGGIAKNYIRIDPDFEALCPNPPACSTAGAGGTSNCTADDWANWRAEQACLPKNTQLCIYYDCCDHSCDRAIFNGVYYTRQMRLGHNPDGTPIISEAKRQVFLTANLNNGGDGGPRGPFCATIPSGTLASWSETKTISKTECIRQKITEIGLPNILPATSECSDSEFSIVIDVKDEGQTLTASGTYEGGFDAEPSGIVLYTSFSDALPNPSPLGKALLNLYQGAKIRRAGWASTRYIENNNGFFKLIGCTTSNSNYSGLSDGWNAFNSEKILANLPVNVGGYYTFQFAHRILHNGGIPQRLNYYVCDNPSGDYDPNLEGNSPDSNFGFPSAGQGEASSARPRLTGGQVNGSIPSVGYNGYDAGYLTNGTQALAWSSVVAQNLSFSGEKYVIHKITAGPFTSSQASLVLQLRNSQGGLPLNDPVHGYNFYIGDFSYSTHTRPLVNNDHAINFISTTTAECPMPTQDDMRAGDWQSFGASADASALTCKSLDTYNEPKIGYDEEIWAGSGVQYGDNAQPRVLIPSAGHNGRKIDSIRNRFAFNFTHTLPPSTKTRKLYTHILTERVYQNKLSALFAEDFLKIETETNQPASKVYFVYNSAEGGNYLEGNNDPTRTFNNDTNFESDDYIYGTPYKHIWHDHINPFKITAPINLPSNLEMPTESSLERDATEIFVSDNARTMPFKREIPIENVDIVKIFILIPPRDVPTTLYCSASSFIDKTAVAQTEEE